MRVKCANCGTIYDIHISMMEFRTQLEVLQSGVCSRCKSNAHDPVQKSEWVTETKTTNSKS